MARASNTSNTPAHNSVARASNANDNTPTCSLGEPWNGNRKRMQSKRPTPNANKKRAQEQSKQDKVNRIMESTGHSKAHSESDPFLRKIVGHSNYPLEDDHKEVRRHKFHLCSQQIASRINIRERVIREGIERKPPPGGHKVTHLNQYKVMFHVDPQRDVGDDGTITDIKKIHKLPLVPWLEVKQSTIKDAGLGCFADRNFETGDIIGLYMGSENKQKGTRGYTIETKWDSHIYCYPFQDPRCMTAETQTTMGMQMINDYSYEKERNETTEKAEIEPSLFVRATKSIRAGEEIFIDYNLKGEDTDEEEDDAWANLKPPPMPPTKAPTKAWNTDSYDEGSDYIEGDE